MHKVLLIEDNLELAKMYKRVFTHKGFKIEVSLNGSEGIIAAKNFKPALILLDVMMPQINGFEILEQLKSDPQTSKIKVVLLTNVGLVEELDKAVKKGAEGYIIKNDHHPFEVLTKVESILA